MYNNYLSAFVKAYLPPMANVLSIFIGDIDNDNNNEIIVGYKYQEICYITVLKSYRNKWYILGNIKGPGYNINYINVAPVKEKNKNNLIIGWQVGGIWAQLDILEWTGNNFKRIIDDDIVYSKIEVYNMPSKLKSDKRVEIALWVHDTGDSYKISVYRYSNGKLVIAKDVYPYYFRKIIIFYKQKIKEHPDFGFHWYYLADAQIKAKMPYDAIKSIEINMNLQHPYPSKEELIKLKESIIYNLKNRTINLYPASIKTIDGIKWGYINNKGDFVIQPHFGNAQDFQDNGLASVEENGLYGLINELGHYIVNPKYQYINDFSESRSVVLNQNGFKVIAEKGNEITSKAYDYISTFQGNRALFGGIGPQGSYLYGYLDREGREVIPLKYEYGSNFKDNRAVVKIRENQHALIDPNGNILTTYNYNYVGNIGDGLLAFKKDPDGKFGFIDINGNIIIEPQYTGVQIFNNGITSINISDDIYNKYGVIDKRGNFIIEPKYNDIIFLGEDRIAVGKAIDENNPFIGSKYAIANNEGKMLTDFIYYGVSNYENNIASAYDIKNTFFIDKSGAIIKNLPIVSGSGTLDIEDSIIKAFVDYRLSYLNRNGIVIYEQNKVIPLNNIYKVVEEKYKPNKDYLVYYPQIQGNNDSLNNVNNNLKEMSQLKNINKNIQLDYSYFGDFSVEFFKNNLLVLQINGYEYHFGAAHGMPTKIYANINLENDKMYTLSDLFKKNSNYINVISDIIGSQIKNNKEYEYVFPDSYKGINENQKFYIKEDALYIYFDPYEIAPFMAGFPTFKIPFSDIINIIDVNDEFWKSFN